MQSVTILRLCVMMFLQFFVWGAWYVMAPNFLELIGFQGGDIAWTYSVGPIAGIITPFFVGMIADRFFPTERVLGVLHLAGAGIMYGACQMMLSDAPNPVNVNLVFFGYMLTYYPTLALANSLSMHNLSDSEKYFPIVRVFGTIGWILAGIVLAFVKWENKIEMFYLTAGCAAVLGVYCFTLPHTPPPSKGQKARIGELFGLDAFVLLKKPSFLVFVISSFLICIPLAFYYQLAARTVTQSELAYPSFKMTFGQMSELFFMLLMPLFFTRLGVKWMLFVGMLAWVVRYALFAFGATDQVAWMILIGVALHGICYDFFFVTGQIYTDKVADKRIRGQAQGMLVLFTLGIGMLIGAQVAGQIETYYTPAIKGELAADASSVGSAIKVIESDVATAMEELPDDKRSQVDDKFATLTEATTKSALAPAIEMTLDVPEEQQNFNQLATEDEELQELFASNRAVLDKIEKAKASSGDLTSLEEESESLNKQLAEKLSTLAAEEASTDLSSIEEEAVRDIVADKLAVVRLNGLRDDLSLRSLQSMNWKMIWLIPCVFAAVIMVIFSVTFRDDVSRDSLDADDPVDSEPAVE